MASVTVNVESFREISQVASDSEAGVMVSVAVVVVMEVICKAAGLAHSTSVMATLSTAAE